MRHFETSGNFYTQQKINTNKYAHAHRTSQKVSRAASSFPSGLIPISIQINMYCPINNNHINIFIGRCKRSHEGHHRFVRAQYPCCSRAHNTTQQKAAHTHRTSQKVARRASSFSSGLIPMMFTRPQHCRESSRGSSHMFPRTYTHKHTQTHT